MSRNFRGRPSRRDILERNDLSIKFLAAASGKECPPGLLNNLPPKRIRRPSTGRAPRASEHQEQAAVISWWARAHNLYSLPEFALFAVPNGGARDPIAGALLKAEGVRRGVYDLMLAWPVGAQHGLFIEMKVGYKQPSDEQRDFGEHLTRAGYEASVHWDAGSAIQAIQTYLGPLP